MKISCPPYAAWRDTARYFSYEGHRIAYYAGGAEGPLLTLIHGFPTSSHDWARVWPLLENGYRLLALDLLGYGGSAKPRPYAYSIMEQASIVEALWAKLGIVDTHLVAHDYGASVALELLARDREKRLAVSISSGLLLNGGIVPGAYRPRPVQRFMASRLGPLAGYVLGRSTLARNFRAIFDPDYAISESEIDEFWAAIEEGDGKWVLPYLGRYLHERRKHADRWRDILAMTEVPLGYFWGAYDPISGAAVLAGLRTLNTGARGVALPHGGHYPQWEAPEKLATWIRKFIGT